MLRVATGKAISADSRPRIEHGGRGMAIRLYEPQDEDDWRRARRLVEDYAAALGVDLSFQDFDRELEHLSVEYAPPGGCFRLAEDGGWPRGCVGLRRFADTAKGDFIGRDAVLAGSSRPPDWQFVGLEIVDPGPDALASDPIVKRGEWIGYVTSCTLGFRTEKRLALGYVRHGSLAVGEDYAFDTYVVVFDDIDDPGDPEIIELECPPANNWD